MNYKTFFILLLIPTVCFSQKGYGKIDVGAALFEQEVYPAIAVTAGLKTSNVGFGFKFQGIKDAGFLAMADLRGFLPFSKPVGLSFGFNPGVRVYKNNSNFVMGVDGLFMFGSNKVKPFISGGGIFMRDEIARITIKQNLAYFGLGVLF